MAGNNAEPNQEFATAGPAMRASAGETYGSNHAVFVPMYDEYTPDFNSAGRLPAWAGLNAASSPQYAATPVKMKMNVCATNAAGLFAKHRGRPRYREK